MMYVAPNTQGGVMGTVTSTPPETQGKSVKRDPRFMPFGMYFKPIALENGNPAHQSAWHWWAVWGGICRRLAPDA